MSMPDRVASSETGSRPPRPHVVKLSQRDLLDYRAVQRTFDGAYARTALGQLCYATVILRLFQPKFFYVGLVYAILGLGFIPVAIFRYHMAVSNAQRFVALENVESPHNSFANEHEPQAPPSTQLPDHQTPSMRQHVPTLHESAPSTRNQEAMPTPVQTVLRENFVTAGSVVAGATAFVGSVEIALLVLILRL